MEWKPKMIMETLIHSSQNFPSFHDFTSQNQPYFPSLIPNIFHSRIKAVKNPELLFWTLKKSSWGGRICLASNKNHFGRCEWKPRHSSLAGEQYLPVYPTAWEIKPWNLLDLHIYIQQIQRQSPVQPSVLSPIMNKDNFSWAFIKTWKTSGKKMSWCLGNMRILEVKLSLKH